MHIEYDNKEFIKVLIFDKTKIKKIGFNEDNESFFKPIFQTLKNKYHLALNGLYKIDVFILNQYGIILEITHEQDELYDDYIDGVNIKVKINENKKMLFQINDILLIKNKRNIKVYRNDNKYYIMFNNIPSKKELYGILEHSNIIYGQITKKIIKPNNIVKI